MTQIRDLMTNLVKTIIDKELTVYAENKDDDSEYVQRVKHIFEAVDNFIATEKGLGNFRKNIQKDLQDHARKVWILHIKSMRSTDDRIRDLTEEDETYFEYVFDHLYEHGVYPP